MNLAEYREDEILWTAPFLTNIRLTVPSVLLHSLHIDSCICFAVCLSVLLSVPLLSASVCVCVCLCLCVSICVCVYVCLRVCVFLSLIPCVLTFTLARAYWVQVTIKHLDRLSRSGCCPVAIHLSEDYLLKWTVYKAFRSRNNSE